MSRWIKSLPIIGNFNLQKSFRVPDLNAYFTGLRVFNNIVQGFFVDQIEIAALFH